MERGLKAVSDNLDGSELKLKGVMRVGSLAKGLLLRSDAQVDLVLLSSDVPTKNLLETIASKLQSQFSGNKNADSENFSVTSSIENARIEVKASASLCVHVGLTSATVRACSSTTEEDEAKFPEDALPKEKSLNHLASIRHAKW